MSNRHKTPWEVDATINTAVIDSDGYAIASAGSANTAKLICDAVNAFVSAPTAGDNSTTVTAEQNDKRIKELLAVRKKAIQYKDICLQQQIQLKTQQSKEELRSATAALIEINNELKKCGDISRAVSSGSVAKSKKELIGALMAWSAQMQDANKNPKTTAAERLFNSKAIERLQSILKAGDKP
jgi:hypothetical protein